MMHARYSGCGYDSLCAHTVWCGGMHIRVPIHIHRIYVSAYASDKAQSCGLENTSQPLQYAAAWKDFENPLQVSMQSLAGELATNGVTRADYLQCTF